VEALRIALIEATSCAIQESADGKEWPCGTCACALLGKVLPHTAQEYAEHNDPVDRVNEVWRAIVQMRDYVPADEVGKLPTH
jgi:endonuclease YncB( thermonuclease family)